MQSRGFDCHSDEGKQCENCGNPMSPKPGPMAARQRFGSYECQQAYWKKVRDTAQKINLGIVKVQDA